jgi:cell division protein FtsQ
MSERRSGSFSAYSGAREIPLDFAPIRAEGRHAVRPEGKVTDEKAEPARRSLRGWFVVILMTGLLGIAINQYRGILTDYLVVFTEKMPALDLPGFKFPELNRPAINRPINTVRLESRLKSVTEEEVRILLARYTESGFLGVDVQDLRDELEHNPWVARATVKRVWPDALVIRIEEEQAIARWGDAELLNADGVAFAPPMRGTEDHLPALRGPEGSETMMMARFQELSALMSGIGMRLEGLSVNARGSWAAEIEGGLELKIGRDDVEERLQRFVRLYRGGLSEQLANAQTIDLRYSNGISVSNKPAATSSVASR